MTLAERLRQAAAAKGMTALKLAEAVGMDEAGVERVLSGDVGRPPDDRLRRFAEALDVPFEDLLSLIPESQRAAPVTGEFLEARDGGRFRIRVIRGGVSGNGNVYPDRVLREAVPLFNGVRVFVKSDADHLQGRGKDVRNLIGRLVEPAFVEGQGSAPGEIQATLELIEPDGGVARQIRHAWDRGMTGLFGFSIDAQGAGKAVRQGGRSLREAQRLAKGSSVDLIVEPGAGGAIINLIEAQTKEDAMRSRLIEAIKAKKPQLLEGKDTDALTDEEIEGLYREAITGAADEGDDEDDDEGGAPFTREDATELVRMSEARAYARAAIAGSTLPEAAKARLTKQFGDRDRFTEADVDGAIKDEREYVARFTESGHVTGLGGLGRIASGETRAEKVVNMLDAFFDPENRDVRSFKECYIEITGDRRFTGQIRECDPGLMREALDSGSWADVLGDSIRRRMVAEYNRPSQYDIWRQLASVVSAGDFRTNERTRVGGYGDLPDVAESGPYTALASPTDEKATYAITKRGGTETVTIEMIANDDVGAIQRIPTRLAQSGRRTLSKFVLDFLNDNPTIYDDVALFHGDHGNLGTAALDATTLSARRLAMLKQTELSSADRLGIGPRTLWVPSDLEETAVNLFRRNTNNDRTFIQSLTPDVVPVWYWTDANNWYLTADKMDIPLVEIGFFQGEEEPSLFVQDQPNVGSLFSNDQITYKIRHIYGGAVIDYRGFQGSVVAGG